MLAESTIRRKIHKAIKEGVKGRKLKPKDFAMIDQEWGVEFSYGKERWVRTGQCCCPMGAVLEYYQPANNVLHESAAADALNVTQDFVDGFVSGFDLGERAVGTGANSDRKLGIKVGRSFRKQYIKCQD